MGEKFVLKKSYKTEYKSFKPSVRRELFTKIFFAIMAEMPDATFAVIIKDLQPRIGIPLPSAYRIGKQLNLKGKMDMEKERIETDKDEMAARDADGNVKIDIPLAKVISELKDLGYVGVRGAKKVADVNVRMLEYYAAQIEQKFIAVGGVFNISKDDANQIEYWQKQMSKYADSVKDLLKPSALSALFKVVGIEMAVVSGMENIDQAAFTMARLQEVFNEEMGKADGTPYTIIGDGAAVDKAFDKYKEDMPDITGTR